MSFESRFELSLFSDEVDIDLSLCEDCPHRHIDCWKAEKCLIEEDDAEC